MEQESAPLVVRDAQFSRGACARRSRLVRAALQSQRAPGIPGALCDSSIDPDPGPASFTQTLFQPIAPNQVRSALTQSAAGRLKQLDEISGWVREQNLRSPWPGHDVIAELDTGGAQPRDLGRNIPHDKVDAVPAAGTGT